MASASLKVALEANRRAAVNNYEACLAYREGFREGEVGVLQVLDAERAYQRALLGEIRVRTAQYLDAVELSVALGGNSIGASQMARGIRG